MPGSFISFISKPVVVTLRTLKEVGYVMSGKMGSANTTGCVSKEFQKLLESVSGSSGFTTFAPNHQGHMFLQATRNKVAFILIESNIGLVKPWSQLKIHSFSGANDLTRGLISVLKLWVDCSQSITGALS